MVSVLLTTLGSACSMAYFFGIFLVDFGSELPILCFSIMLFFVLQHFLPLKMHLVLSLRALISRGEAIPYLSTAHSSVLL